MKLKSCKFLIPIILAGAIPSLQGATIAAGDVTTTLGPDFFFDTASTGGGDTNASSTYVFNRNFGTLNVGSQGTAIRITGFGFASGASMVTATQVSMTITYLGADGALNGGDDVTIGTVTDAINGSSTGTEYVWKFDTPLNATFDGANSIFRFDITASGGGAALRFKTTSGTNISAAKFSVAGTSSAVIPEPTSALAGLLIGLGLLRRRRTSDRGLCGPP